MTQDIPPEKAPEPLREALADADIVELLMDWRWGVFSQSSAVQAVRSLVARAALASTAPSAEKAREQGAPLSGFTKIPVGTLLGHDFGFYRWPDCKNTEPVDPDTVFEVREGRSIELTAPGFGEKGDYGNGSILVKRAHWLEAWQVAPPAASEAPPAREWPKKRDLSASLRQSQERYNGDVLWNNAIDLCREAAEAGSAPLPGFNAEAWRRLGIKPHSTLAHIKTDDELHDLVEECIRLDREDRAGSAPLVLPEPPLSGEIRTHLEARLRGFLGCHRGIPEFEAEIASLQRILATPLSPKQEPPEPSVHPAVTPLVTSGAGLSNTTDASRLPKGEQ